MSLKLSRTISDDLNSDSKTRRLRKFVHNSPSSLPYSSQLWDITQRQSASMNCSVSSSISLKTWVICVVWKRPRKYWILTISCFSLLPVISSPVHMVKTSQRESNETGRWVKSFSFSFHHERVQHDHFQQEANGSCNDSAVLILSQHIWIYSWRQKASSKALDETTWNSIGLRMLPKKPFYMCKLHTHSTG